MRGPSITSAQNAQNDRSEPRNYKVQLRGKEKTMKNIKRHEALLGVGLLSAVTVFGVAQPTLAKPDKEVKAARKDVKEARKELKQEKKDVAKADTRRERRQEYQDVKAARQNVQTERQD
jgi:hypothetical protein